MSDDLRDFHWGRVLEVHTAGAYTILEFVPNQPSNVSDREWAQRPHLSFAAFVGDKDTHHSFHSLDEALAFCIAYRAEGPNTRASQYFIRSLGLETT